MPQTKQGETITNHFGQGWVTEQTPINPVPNSFVSGSDYVVQKDGSLRRRRGINEESGGVSENVADVTTLYGGFNSYIWRDVAGDPDTTFTVVQTGTILRFYTDASPLSAGLVGQIDLENIAAPDSTDVGSDAVSMSSGRGVLFIASPKIEQSYIAYENSSFFVTPITIYERDFKGVDDGTPWTSQPATLTDAHRYNLANRGWRTADMTAFFGLQTAYPGKNMIPWMGYKRTGGVQEWDSAKMAAEFFGAASAPQGRLLLNIFDTNAATGSTLDPTAGAGVGQAPIATWSVADQLANPWLVTITLDTPHGLTSGSSVVIEGNKMSLSTPISGTYQKSLDGSYSAIVTSTNTFLIAVDRGEAGLIGTFVNQYISMGVVYGVNGSSDPDLGNALVRDGGYQTNKRPRAIAFWAGRVWYAGIQHPELADRVYHSQVLDDVAKAGRCYQENDPTSRDFNAVQATDGGAIQIPGLSGVYAAYPVGGSLILMSSSGLWEITGGQGGFTATSYRTRQLSEAECTSTTGGAMTDFGFAAVTRRGLMLVDQDPSTGFLSAQNISLPRISTAWNALTDYQLSRAQMAYDDATRRLHIVLPTATQTEDFHIAETMITLAEIIPVGSEPIYAFYKATLPTDTYSTGTNWVLGVVSIAGGDNPALSNKIKFFVETGDETGNVLTVCDQSAATYSDVIGDEIIPSIIAAHDASEQYNTRKYVTPYIVVFSKRTETGYLAVEEGWMPINTSGTLLAGRWDFADATSSGKFSTTQQVYRHARLFIPSSSSDVPPNEVIVTRNKIRGSGRALQIQLTGQAGKDSHVLGWTIDYSGSR